MASSSSPPPWAILGRIADVCDVLPPGYETNVCIKLVRPPLVSHLTVPRHIFPQPITHRDPNNPSIIAVDTSGGILLLHAILSRAASGSTIRIKRPGHNLTVVKREFISSYFVLDEASDCVLPLPNAALIKNPANVGIIYFAFGAGRYVVAELQLSEGPDHSNLLFFASHIGDWTRKRVSCHPRLPRSFDTDCVLSYNGKLWWVDLSLGLITCDPLDNSQVLTFIQLPRGKMLNYKREASHSLGKYRLMRVSGGKLCFVDMHRDEGDRKVSVWTLEAYPGSTPKCSDWKLDHVVKFADIYKHNRMPDGEPILALINPNYPSVVYFILGERLFGVNLSNFRVTESSVYHLEAPSRDLLSSYYLHAWVTTPPLCSSLGNTNLEIEARSQGLKFDNEVPLQGYDERIYILQSFRRYYGESLCLQSLDSVENISKYAREHGQTMTCIRLALIHYNSKKNDSCKIVMNKPKDSNAFNPTACEKYVVELCYYHTNFYARNSSGEDQLFFAELNGINGPENVSTVMAGLLKFTRQGILHSKLVPVYINSSFQVVLKMPGTHMVSAFIITKKCRELEDGNHKRRYFGIRMVERVIKFECKNKCNQHRRVHGITEKLLHRDSMNNAL